MKHIVIIYGTTGGNTQTVCQQIAQNLEEHSLMVRLIRAEIATEQDLTSGDALILASPTYGHGALEYNFHKFFECIQHADLQNIPCAVVGLGDPKYDLDYFLESEKILTRYIQTHNGTILLDSLKIAKSPYTYLEKWIPQWSQKFFIALQQHETNTT